MVQDLATLEEEQRQREHSSNRQPVGSTTSQGDN